MRALLLVAGLASALAHAQEPSSPPLPENPVEAPLVQPVEQPVIVQPLPVPARIDAPVREEDPGGRTRWGIGGGIGWHSPYPAFGLNMELRVGRQFTNAFALYVAAGGHLGLGAGVGVGGLSGSASGTLIGHFTMAALLELTLGNHYWLAAGPAFGLGGMALGGLGIATTGGTITGVSAGGFKPGFNVRTGWQFGAQNPRTHKRRGVSVGIDVMVLWH